MGAYIVLCIMKESMDTDRSEWRFESVQINIG